MHLSSITRLAAAAALATALFLPTAAQADDKDKADTNKAAREGIPKEKSKDAKPAQAINKLKAGFTLIDYGREQNDPATLLVAARILGTTPVNELKYEAGEGNDQAGSKALPFDNGAALKKQAQGLIGEARKMAKELPKAEREAVEALAASTALMLKEKSRGVAGRPAYHHAFIRPGGAGNPYVLRNVNLAGNYTWFKVQSLNGMDLDIKVVGALTGIVYGRDNYPNPHASVGFNHFPVCVVNIFVENHSPQIGEFILTSN